MLVPGETNCFAWSKLFCSSAENKIVKTYAEIESEE